MGQPYNLSIWKGKNIKFKARLIYIENQRLAGATQDLVSKRRWKKEKDKRGGARREAGRRLR